MKKYLFLGIIFMIMFFSPLKLNAKVLVENDIFRFYDKSINQEISISLKKTLSSNQYSSQCFNCYENVIVFKISDYYWFIFYNSYSYFGMEGSRYIALFDFQSNGRYHPKNQSWDMVPSSTGNSNVKNAFSLTDNIVYSTEKFELNGHIFSEGSIPEYMPKGYYINQKGSQVNSFDLYFKKSTGLSSLDFKINFFNYWQGNGTTPTISNFYFYGLVKETMNDKNIYHWKKIGIDENIYIENDEFSDIDNGFSFQGKVKLNFTNYEEIRVVMELVNGFDFKIDYWASSDKTDTTDGELNYFDLNYSRNFNQSQDNRYAVFSTKEQSEINSLYIKNSKDKLYADIFYIESSSFDGYSMIGKHVFLKDYYKFNYDIGIKNKKGFYILTDKNETENIRYWFYTNDKLYFSFNNSPTLDDSIFVDKDGNITVGGIEITPDEKVDMSFMDYLRKAEKYINSLKDRRDDFNELFQSGYKEIPLLLRTGLELCYCVFLGVILIKEVSW